MKEKLHVLNTIVIFWHKRRKSPDRNGESWPCVIHASMFEKKNHLMCCITQRHDPQNVICVITWLIKTNRKLDMQVRQILYLYANNINFLKNRRTDNRLFPFLIGCRLHCRLFCEWSQLEEKEGTLLFSGYSF